MITVHFYLRFRSTYGQTFFVSGDIPELGNNDPAQAVPIHYLNEELWHHSIDIAEDTPAFTYKYILRTADGFESIEWPADRSVDVAQYGKPEIQIVDYWNYPGEYENSFYTQPFQQTLFSFAGEQIKIKKGKNINHILKVKAPLLGPDETLCVVGSDEKMGAWQAENCIPMRKEGNWYMAAFDLSKSGFPISYKYGVYNTALRQFMRYENCPDRWLHGVVKKQLVILHDGFAAFPNNSFRGAGVAIPVFSLRSANSWGAGEFNDIKLLADWAAHTGMKLIQLLPVNDTSAIGTWQDSYPYAAISAFALHPLFINPESVAGNKYGAIIKEGLKKKKSLNELTEVDYEAVMQLKWDVLRRLFAEMKEAWLANEDYQAFLSENRTWLEPYAAFCYLREKYKTVDFNQWKKDSSYNEKTVARLLNPAQKDFDEVAIHLFVQWHLHLQLKDAVAHAHRLGLVVKGDIPIGIYRYSCDAWQEPHLYNMDYQAGAPPDDFAIKGQNWGFPTYNWQRMKEDGFGWWKRRFNQMSRYFDAFRIDHILGFFRIWSIPMHAVEGIMGRFVPCLPVHINEFHERGIGFDYLRLCRPFINTSIVSDFFGEKADFAKETFLNETAWDSYELKPGFTTQREVEQWFADNPHQEEWIKYKLYDLISNLILFEEPGSNATQFHFRIAMDGTTSFQWLPDGVKSALRDLYVDYYFKRQNDFWRTQAMQKLPALKAATHMLVCGEDLGMVPECVPGVMKELGFLSLEIQRMPKNPKVKFFHPADAPYLSVVTPSTHDMSTLRGWWEENRDNTQQFYNEQMGQWGGAPFFCEPWINRAIVTMHVYSPAMWSIFQLQDLLGNSGELRRSNPEEERINVPANPKHYWRYRMHLPLEQLLKEKAFNDDLRSLFVASGRA